jgi:hypothetical protein
MRKLLTFLIALGAVVFGVCSPAGAWGCREFGRQGGTGCNSVIAGSPPVGPPIFTYQTDDPAWSGTSTLTSSAEPIGSAFATRRVVFMIRVGDVGSTLSSGTIGGVTLDTLIRIGSDGTSLVYLVSAIVPIGTTAAAVLNFTGSIFSIVSTTFTTDNAQLASSTPITSFASVASGTTLTGSVAVLAGGSILAICIASGSTTNPQITASTAGLSNDGKISNFYSSGHANGAPANAASSVTETWIGSAATVLALAAYR